MTWAVRRACIGMTVLLAALLTARADAQGVDVIRGEVRGSEGRPLVNVTVTATTARGGVNRTARTDARGHYTITFPGGEGHYFLVFTAVGYVSRRTELRRMADEDVLIADVELRRMALTLDTIEVVGDRPRVSRSEGRQPDMSGTEQAAARDAVAPDQQGNVYGLAGTVPGAMMAPGADGDPAGFSVLGLPLEQSVIALNGMGFAGTALPRDANVSASLVTTPFDVSRGGFSGGQFNLRPAPGSNFIRRSTSLNVTAAPLQLTDAAARSLGQRYTDLSLGGLVSGPVVLDRAFYSVAYQVDRRSNDLRTLMNTSPEGLQAAGVAADSAARLVALLEARGIPVVPEGGLRSSRADDRGSILGTIDLLGPSSGASHTLNATFNGSWKRQVPAGASAGEVPAASGERTSWDAGLQVNHSAYIRHFILSETTVEATSSRSSGEPYVHLPSASVLVRSDFADGTTGISRLAFGGHPSLGTHSMRTSVGVRNQASWVSRNNRHRLKATAELRRLGFESDQSRNLLGTFSYASLADLEADRPASFTRSLLPRRQDASEYLYALSFGDSYRPRRDLQIQYGVRMDGHRFPRRPEFNQAVLDTFGVRNDGVPNRVHLSPRVGFAWTYGSAPQVTAFEGAARAPRAVVRGGIGIFQSTPAAWLLNGAMETTGLPAGVQQVRCIGDAVPPAAWASIASDPDNIARACADGTTGAGFSSTAPDVILFARGYRPPRSLRGNLQWNGPILGNRFTATIEGTYSRNMHQPEFVDLNFDPTVRFTLPGEGGRPVYVHSWSVVAGTGAASATASRVSSGLDHVTEHRSALESDTRQLRLSLSPVRFSSSASWAASYVYSRTEEQYRGFTSSDGDPRGIGRSPSDFDARHQFTLNLAYNLFDVVRLSSYARLASGTPFTPLVGGDINGDGYANDRAFVFDPPSAYDPAMAAAMERLLTDGPAGVRECLGAQRGRIAARTSCRGPWTSDAQLALALNPTKVGLSQRVAATLHVNNPLGALDHALHRREGLRGWGEHAMPERTLLIVRGFDPTTNRYRYDVNPRFGSTNPQFSAFRRPVSLTLSVRVDVGPSREQQTIIRQLDQGRRTPGARMSEAVMQGTYGSGGMMNPMAQLLRQGDSLRLDGRQADSIASMNVRYIATLDSIWRTTAAHLAALPPDYDRGEAYSVYRQAREASVDLLLAMAPRVMALLTDAQRRALPALVASHLDHRYLKGIRSGTIGDSGAGVFSNTNTGTSGGATVRRTDIITRGSP